MRVGWCGGDITKHEKNSVGAATVTGCEEEDEAPGAVRARFFGGIGRGSCLGGKEQPPCAAAGKLVIKANMGPGLLAYPRAFGAPPGGLLLTYPTTSRVGGR